MKITSELALEDQIGLTLSVRNITFLLYLYFTENCTVTAGPKSNLEVGFTTAGKKCIFPFTQMGVTYNACTMDWDSYGKAWCSTKVFPNGSHVHNEYGYCTEDCPIGMT